MLGKPGRQRWDNSRWRCLERRSTPGFANAELLTYEDGVYVIGVQNAYARDWLEERLLSTVKRVLTGIVGRTVEVRFTVWQGRSRGRGAGGGAARRSPVGPSDWGPLPFQSPLCLRELRRRLRQPLAHAAAQAVAENPARCLQPPLHLRRRGPGEDALLHAVGNAAWRRGLNVLYVTSEEFTNDLINAIRNHTTDSFRERYRSIDVLLIDDIQFIAGKESTQEEFFHTFNALHGQDKQLVISSDRPPRPWSRWRNACARASSGASRRTSSRLTSRRGWPSCARRRSGRAGRSSPSTWR